MASGKRVRALPWLITRSQPVFQSEYREELVRIAQSRLPNGAYDGAYLLTGDMETAKACRWLAQVKRDHGRAAFCLAVSSKTKVPRPTSTGSEKGAEKMADSRKPTGQANSEAENGTISIPLEHIDFRVSLNGAFASVKTVQRFGNKTQASVEAVYVFPLPDDASVIGCQMVIGERKVKAELKKRREARQEYDDAISQGHHGALLEQERPNIFTMNVGGIEPGENISVEVDYVQRVPWQAGGGRFRIPLVAAPQFIPGAPTEKMAGGWSPDTTEVPDASRITPKLSRESVLYNADIAISFSPGFRCTVYCPSHPAVIQRQTVAKKSTVQLKTGEILTDRDFTLFYESLSVVPEVSLHSGQFGNESFALASIFPPAKGISVGSDIVLVLDCSGSMDGPAIAGLTTVAKKVVQNLRKENAVAGNRVGIVPFNSEPLPSFILSEISDATEKFIDGLCASGGTMLGLALQKAEQMLAMSSRQKTILMITDGDTEHGKDWFGNGIRLVAVGIGTAVNDSRINELARRNNGVAEFVYPGEDYSSVANRLSGYLSGPVLTEVKVEAGTGEVVGVSDVFEGRPVVIAVRFSGKPAEIRVSGKITDKAENAFWELDPADAKECDFSHQIWAREVLRTNRGADVQTEVSLRYGVICQHTSFVAVSLKEVPGQQPERVEIPVNLPDGWNPEAVAGAFGSPLAMCVMEKAHHLDGVAGFETNRLRAEWPVLLSPRPGKPVRFNLKTKDPVDRLIAILNTLPRNPGDAKQAFERLKNELTAEVITKLDDDRRAMAFYFSLRLAKCGLALDQKVMEKLSLKPKNDHDSAAAWYNLAQKEQGRPSNLFVPAGYASAEYIAWKIGKGPRPTTGDWAEVV